MSPEQATGDRDVDPRTDIYALGCVLYEMLIGEPPYTGSTAQAILGKIIQGKPISVTEARGTVPPNVDAVIRKALEKLPADRFASAAEFAKALADPGFRQGEGAAAGAGTDTTRLRRLLIVTGSLAALMTLALLWSISALLRPEPPAPVERFAVEMYPGFGEMGIPSLLPDGSGMVYGVSQLMLRRWGSLDPVPVSGGVQLFLAGTPVVSPSGAEVAFITASNELKVVPLGGGIVRTLATAAGCCMRWGTDGFVYYSACGGAQHPTGSRDRGRRRGGDDAGGWQ
jgi:serine/threonine-protein kinase